MAGRAGACGGNSGRALERILEIFAEALLLHRILDAVLDGSLLHIEEESFIDHIGPQLEPALLLVIAVPVAAWSPPIANTRAAALSTDAEQRRT